MIFRRRAVLALLTALFALALTATASAEVIINSTADEPDAVAGGVCETAAGGCTLRAAIEVTNAAGTAQDVFFNSAPFDGQGADTVVLTSPLPPIEAPISLIAARWGSPSKPAAGVSGPTGNFGITVEADGVTIRNVSITGALTGINVINRSENFTATGNWIGVKLDGVAGPNNTGIFIDPESDGATIGTTVGPPEFAQPNVIAGNNNEGLDIEGASNAVIRNNYFGVAPDGTTQMANAKNIEITDSTATPGFPAENNEIGDTIEGAALASEACDGGCNVISGATGTGIDLNGSGLGELPATGPTTVHGNYVGLDVAGFTPVASSALFDILAGEADEATIGGPADGDANFIAGGGYGVYGEEGEALQVLGNEVGFNVLGNAVTAPSSVGVYIYSLGLAEPAVVSDNAIGMDGGKGIEQVFGGAEIIENFIEGGQYGIVTKGEPGVAGGNLIAGNGIVEPEINGILIENDLNEVLGNIVIEAGDAGVRVQNPAALLVSTENLIGGDSQPEENTILGSGGPAIEIVDAVDASAESENEIARNNGLFNGGLFIDLVGEANGEIKSPAFATATQSTASGGGAVAGARIRVFANATKSPGQIGGFLAETVADGKGNWKVTYPSIATGTAVGATQTSPAAGTSELSYATAAADPSPDKGKDKTKEPDVIADPLCAFTAGKCRWPETVITRGPKGKTHATTVKFRFTSDMPGSTFECKLDKKPFKKCKSPKKYKGLKPGKHVFKVRATNTEGKVDPVPAKKKFRVLAPK